jgi:hypothetical protein
MDFREATDQLCTAITHEDVARSLGVSVQSIRQARMNGNSTGQRKPPDNWEDALVTLARNRIGYLERLIVQLESEGEK